MLEGGGQKRVEVQQLPHSALGMKGTYLNTSVPEPQKNVQMHFYSFKYRESITSFVCAQCGSGLLTIQENFQILYRNTVRNISSKYKRETDMTVTHFFNLLDSNLEISTNLNPFPQQLGSGPGPRAGRRSPPISSPGHRSIGGGSASWPVGGRPPPAPASTPATPSAASEKKLGRLLEFIITSATIRHSGTHFKRIIIYNNKMNCQCMLKTSVVDPDLIPGSSCRETSVVEPEPNFLAKARAGEKALAPACCCLA